jgi:D-alanyl-lipoteichoic acid acyltransferase DltB (MBOAT superfamily)
LIDYVCGLVIERSEGRKRWWWLVISIISNIGLLSYFKYTNFFIDMFNETAPWVHISKHIKNLDIILPIGLSFHTFQSLSYTIEVYRNKQKAEKHIGYFANYVLFFPQMVAGPIERYERLGNELRISQKLSYDNVSHGLRLILYGLFVKMCIADNLAPLVDEVYQAPLSYYSSSVWMAMIAFAIQIYADFYGYSTVALGAARMLGIHLMDNFKQPYFATGIQDFWKRWHISLSTWFRDYVFFSMGGSKVKVFRWIINILFLFAVSGFWHGANYTYIIWGLLHGIVYLLDKGISNLIPTQIKQLKFYSILSMLLTFTVVVIIWVFFRAKDLKSSLSILKQSTGYGFEANIHLQVSWIPLFMLGLFILIEIAIINTRFDNWLASKKNSIRWSIYIVLILCLLLFSGIKSIPFIYFQF